MIKIGWKKEELEKIVKESFSVSECLKKLGLIPIGGNYKTFHKWCIIFKLDTSHFLGQAYNRGKVSPNRGKYQKPLKELLVKNSFYSNECLKQRLLKDNILQRKCYSCKRKRWNGQEIPIELEHINGDSFDNRKENLTFLCPNCHAQTETYKGRNTKEYKENLNKIYKCKDCDKQISKYSKTGRCNRCSVINRYKNAPVAQPD